MRLGGEPVALSLWKTPLLSAISLWYLVSIFLRLSPTPALIVQPLRDFRLIRNVGYIGPLLGTSSRLKGSVYFDDKTPVVDGCRVDLFRAGRKELALESATECDRGGKYSFDAVRAGSFYIRVTPLGRHIISITEGYVSEFFPSAIDPKNAEAVDVGAGQELTLRLMLTKQHLLSLSGRIAGESRCQRHGHVEVYRFKACIRKQM